VGVIVGESGDDANKRQLYACCRGYRVSVRGAPGAIRVIAGYLRGSRLAVPDRPGLRPTPNRVRETLFNWLAPVIEGARVLDLFAGTGALGIEALSRGAAAATLVERDPGLAAALVANLDRLKVAGGTVEPADAMAWLAGTPRSHDIVFVDPPFASGLWTPAAQALDRGWLAPSAWVYVEAPAAAPLQLPPHWRLQREGHAGALQFALYRVAAGIR